MQIKSIALLALPFFALLASAAPADSQEQPTTGAQQDTAPANSETKTTCTGLTKQQLDALGNISKDLKDAATCFQATHFKDPKVHADLDRQMSKVDDFSGLKG
ncbi:hypothetical protein BDA99DRAFT_533230 [Phascolomyces articulosus]|uniref:Uncharacterized protein n=1 Tax=Phascolomyces articulosus TaxID=60185 RepID=A0AAD5K8L6_9FUNG|nr:hypothetical protein BDA99DRAFT_533230 [Phascolomyces articulosus]